ncbi:hypothetical protein BU15DRAFT_67041 [Melanogaster broomeanus]|nr:hypothetical protein BU15DRAFT_67041 [Melanogaster broomeanus]
MGAIIGGDIAKGSKIDPDSEPRIEPFVPTEAQQRYTEPYSKYLTTSLPTGPPSSQDLPMGSMSSLPWRSLVGSRDPNTNTTIPSFNTNSPEVLEQSRSRPMLVLTDDQADFVNSLHTTTHQPLLLPCYGEDTVSPTGLGLLFISWVNELRVVASTEVAVRAWSPNASSPSHTAPSSGPSGPGHAQQTHPVLTDDQVDFVNTLYANNMPLQLRVLCADDGGEAKTVVEGHAAAGGCLQPSPEHDPRMIRRYRLL